MKVNERSASRSNEKNSLTKFKEIFNNAEARTWLKFHRKNFFWKNFFLYTNIKISRNFDGLFLKREKFFVHVLLILPYTTSKWSLYKFLYTKLFAMLQFYNLEIDYYPRGRRKIGFWNFIKLLLLLLLL